LLQADVRSKTSCTYRDNGQVLGTQRPRQPVLWKRNIEKELKRWVVVRCQCTVNKHTGRCIRNNLNHFRIEIMGCRRAGANELAQKVMLIADKRTIRWCIPKLRPWVVGQYPATAGVQAFGDNTQTGANIIRAQRPIAKDVIELCNKASSIEFGHEACQPP